MPKRNDISGTGRSASVRSARLELLETFQVLYRQRSVTRAAKVLGKSQPTVSKELARLRTWFGDELFVRRATGMEPTEKAEAMAVGVQRILKELDGLASRQAFRAEDLCGPFVVSTTDEVQQQLVARLLPVLTARAPQLRWGFTALGDVPPLRELDLGVVHAVVTTAGIQADHVRRQLLFTDEMVCVMRKQHPLSRGGLTLSRFAGAAHLKVAANCHGGDEIDILLAREGLQRFVRLSLSSYALAAQLLKESELVTCIPRRFVRHLGRVGGLVTREIPSSVKLSYFLYWHERTDEDPGQLWFRRLLGNSLKARASKDVDQGEKE